MADRDIIDAIANFRVAFQRLRMGPPEVILLKSHDDGMLLLGELSQGRRFLLAGPLAPCRPIESSDGSVWQEIEVMGMKVRWPANKIATESGFHWM